MARTSARAPTEAQRAPHRRDHFPQRAQSRARAERFPRCLQTTVAPETCADKARGSTSGSRACTQTRYSRTGNRCRADSFRRTERWDRRKALQCRPSLHSLQSTAVRMWDSSSLRRQRAPARPVRPANA
eukprot:Amastigsp_a843593_10.p3 type:complete len:129 gc:universal Amastigsp_a843593_10:453-67(-)